MKRVFDKSQALFRTVPLKIKTISCQEAAMIINRLRGTVNDVSAEEKIALAEHLRTCTVCGAENA